MLTLSQRILACPRNNSFDKADAPMSVEVLRLSTVRTEPRLSASSIAHPSIVAHHFWLL